jgi:hypothetical protein
MLSLYLKAAGLLVVALIAVLVVGHSARRQKVVHHKYYALFGAASLLCFLGFVPGVTSFVRGLHMPTSEAGAWLLTLSVIGVGVCAGMLFAGRQAVGHAVRGTIGRLRLAVEEMRNPGLRRKNECIRSYERAVTLMSTPVEGRPERMRRNRLASALFFAQLDGWQIATIAQHLNLTLLDNTGNRLHLVEFLEKERDLAAQQPLEVSGHAVRLVYLANRLRRESAA